MTVAAIEDAGARPRWPLPSDAVRTPFDSRSADRPFAFRRNVTVAKRTRVRPTTWPTAPGCGRDACGRARSAPSCPRPGVATTDP